MPFFYSQHLKDDRPTGRIGGGSLKCHPPPQTAAERRLPASAPRRPTVQKQPSSRRLVWHSNIGASGKRNKAQSNYKPLKYSADGKKVVHFATIEVQPFHFDWSCKNDVFYTRPELTAMGQSRFDDAATLRKQLRLDEKSVDDVGISNKSKVDVIANLLSAALEDEDRDENVSIRGIEHFVYPGLQQEMIRRKKEVQREVLDFVRSKRADPQGWRLAEHSRSFSQWARNVALEKGMKACINNAAGDPEIDISEDELQRFQKSHDDMDQSERSLRGSCSFTGGSSTSFDVVEPENAVNLDVLHETAEDGKTGYESNESRVSQPAGDGSGEE